MNMYDVNKVGVEGEVGLLSKAFNHEFPFDVFPEYLQRFIEKMSEAFSIPKDTIAATMLVILSAAVGNSIRVSPKASWEEPLFIWLIIIGQSGSGKSPFMNKLVDPVHKKQIQAKREFDDLKKEYENKLIQYKYEQKEYEKALKGGSESAIAPTEPEEPKLTHLIMSDTTVEALSMAMASSPRGLLIHVDELSGFVKGLNQYKANGSDRQKYLELWNCKPWKIDRIGRGTIYISDVGCSILGGIQPLIMPDIFNLAAFIDGLLPRFLITDIGECDSLYTFEEVTESDMEVWVSLINTCYEFSLNKDQDGQNCPVILRLSKEAEKLFALFQNEYLTEIKRELPGIFTVIVPKMVNYTLRLAGILHVIKNDNTIIEKSTIVEAIKLAKYFLSQTLKALNLYYFPYIKTNISEVEVKLIYALYSLKDSVTGGNIQIAAIAETLNGSLSEAQKLSNQNVSNVLRKFNLLTKTGTGGYSYLIWDTNKIEKLFSQYITPTSPSTPTS